MVPGSPAWGNANSPSRDCDEAQPKQDHGLHGTRAHVTRRSRARQSSQVAKRAQVRGPLWPARKQAGKQAGRVRQAIRFSPGGQAAHQSQDQHDKACHGRVHPECIPVDPAAVKIVADSAEEAVRGRHGERHTGLRHCCRRHMLAGACRSARCQPNNWSSAGGSCTILGSAGASCAARQEQLTPSARS